MDEESNLFAAYRQWFETTLDRPVDFGQASA